MTNVLKPVDKNCIARWVYTKEEWRHFERWHARHKGIFNYIFHFIIYKKHIQAIEFTEQAVQIGKRLEVFSSPSLTLKRIDIDNKGKINVMNITCQYNSNESQLKEIKLPIPKGKLKEAIEIQARLLVGSREPHPTPDS